MLVKGATGNKWRATSGDLISWWFNIHVYSTCIKHACGHGFIWYILTYSSGRLHCRDHSGHGLSQWEMMLHCNVICHSISLYPEWPWFILQNTILVFSVECHRTSTLIQVMAWCLQAISHYLNQFRPSSMTPMAADALAPCAAWTSAVTILIV